MSGRTKGTLLILIGGLLLAHNLGYLTINFMQLLRTWRPAVLVIIGIGFFFPSGK